MDTILSICDMTYGLFTYSSGYAAIPGLSSSHSYSSFEPMAQPNTPFPRSMFLYLFVSLPALYRARYASEQSSVCMARSLRSDWASISPTAFGIPPIPSCSVEPSTIYGISSSAIFRSTSRGACVFTSANGSCSPSMIISTSDMWIHSSYPPRILGMCSFTSTITMSAFLAIGAATPVFTEKLK